MMTLASSSAMSRPSTSLHFLEERSTILQPVLAHAARVIKDHREYELAVRASQVLLDAEEPSARTFFCAKAVVGEYIAKHPSDPRGHRELGKVYLFSCGGQETIDAAEGALLRSAELSNREDPETSFLLASCYRTRLLTLPSHSPSYTQTFSNAEHYLKLALFQSHNSPTYRFALSDFYSATEHPDLALQTLEEGLSGVPDNPADAAVWEELGKYGMKVVPDLLGKGNTNEAREVAEGAVNYLRKALEWCTEVDVEGEWRVELEEAEAVLEDLKEGSVFEFSAEPDFNPRRPYFWDNNGSSEGTTPHGTPTLPTSIQPYSRQNASQLAEITPRGMGADFLAAALQTVADMPSNGKLVQLRGGGLEDAAGALGWVMNNNNGDGQREIASLPRRASSNSSSSRHRRRQRRSFQDLPTVMRVDTPDVTAPHLSPKDRSRPQTMLFEGPHHSHRESVLLPPPSERINRESIYADNIEDTRSTRSSVMVDQFAGAYMGEVKEETETRTASWTEGSVEGRMSIASAPERVQQVVRERLARSASCSDAGGETV